MAGKSSTTRKRKSSNVQRTTVRKAPSRSTKTSSGKRKGSSGRRPADAHVLTEHKREITALVLLGIAVFLMVSLYGGDAAGPAGNAVRTGLEFAFGYLGILVPLALLAAAGSMVFRSDFMGAHRWIGLALLVLAVFVLVAAGGVPFGSHSAETFVRADFEGRAGGLGESLYALLHLTGGTVLVGIIGWLAALVGLILATGVTGARVGRRSRHVADAVRKASEKSRQMVEERDRRGVPVESDVPASGRSRFAWGGAEREGRHGESEGKRRLGPVDLVGEPNTTAEHAQDAGAGQGVFGEGFDDWSDKRSKRGPASATARRTVVDGAEAFADIYGDGHASKSAVTGEWQASGGDETAETVEVTRPAEDATVSGKPGPGDGSVESAAGASTADGEAEPGYVLPERAVLRKSSRRGSKDGTAEDVGAVLVEALAQFGVGARLIGTVAGPRVTRYELQLAPGTKVGKVSGLRDDLAYALASTEIRILAPIPGKSAVGVEVPNQRPDFVTLGDIYRDFPKSSGPLMVWLGKDISGKAVYADLTKLPHLLIAGTTGSGKSGCVNCLVSSVLLRSTPREVRMIMVDPKKVELSHYDRVPHLLVPVVTNMKDAAGVLHNLVKEMEDRYELLELDHARSLAEANKIRDERGEKPLPYILVVIDELADLMMASPQEVEDYVIRLAQKSRAVGIHLVVATQRPSADVITGMIKANIPSRIAFAVSSQTDSRVILDVNGAETLLGMGDMLFKPLGSSHLQRVQGAYITEEEIASLVQHWRHQAEPQFREELLQRPPESGKKSDRSIDSDSDELLRDAAEVVVQTGSASVSLLQRRLRVGYTRAGRLIDMLERRGVVGPYEGSKPRQILVSWEELDMRVSDVVGDGSSEHPSTRS